MPDDASQPALDRERLEASCGGDDALRRELVDLYLDDSTDRVSDLRRLAEGEDLDAVRRAAHALKGSAAVVGCAEASEAFRGLELAAGEGRRDVLPGLLQRAAAAWERGCARLRTLAA